jgi:hypothetical protein
MNIQRSKRKQVDDIVIFKSYGFLTICINGFFYRLYSTKCNRNVIVRNVGKFVDTNFVTTVPIFIETEF